MADDAGTYPNTAEGYDIRGSVGEVRTSLPFPSLSYVLSFMFMIMYKSSIISDLLCVMLLCVMCYV